MNYLSTWVDWEVVYVEEKKRHLANKGKTDKKATHTCTDA